MLKQQIIEVGSVLKELQESSGLTVEDLAGALGSNPRTIQRWLADESVPQKEGRDRINQLSQLTIHLYETFSTRDAVRSWMQTNNPYLGGLTPAEATRTGRIDCVENALEALDSGTFI